jgi:hypothetical protein
MGKRVLVEKLATVGYGVGKILSVETADWAAFVLVSLWRLCKSFEYGPNQLNGLQYR